MLTTRSLSPPSCVRSSVEQAQTRSVATGAARLTGLQPCGCLPGSKEHRLLYEPYADKGFVRSCTRVVALRLLSRRSRKGPKLARITSASRFWLSRDRRADARLRSSRFLPVDAFRRTGKRGALPRSGQRLARRDARSGRLCPSSRPRS